MNVPLNLFPLPHNDDAQVSCAPEFQLLQLGMTGNLFRVARQRECDGSAVLVGIQFASVGVQVCVSLCVCVRMPARRLPIKIP